MNKKILLIISLASVIAISFPFILGSFTGDMVLPDVDLTDDYLEEFYASDLVLFGQIKSVAISEDVPFIEYYDVQIEEHVKHSSIENTIIVYQIKNSLQNSDYLEINVGDSVLFYLQSPDTNGYKIRHLASFVMESDNLERSKQSIRENILNMNEN